MTNELKKYPLKRVLFWTPRILGILFALFVSIFALDVFGAGYGFWGSIAAFLVHLVPVYVLFIGLVVAWRWPWVGALIFIGFAGWYLSQAWGRFPISVYLVMVGIPFVVGVLWLLDWLYKPDLRHSPHLGNLS